MPSPRRLTLLLALVGSAAVAAAATPAVALEGRLQALGSSTAVIIWRDEDAHAEGLGLIEAGVLKTNPVLLLPLISCLVEPGTRAATTDMGFHDVLTHDVVVIEGEHSGCRGNIPIEALKAGGS